MLKFVAVQTRVLPDAVDGYLAAERNRRVHAVELHDRLRLRPFGTCTAADLTAWLLQLAIEDERFIHLARLDLEECRQRRIALPYPGCPSASLRLGPPQGAN